MGLGYKVDFYNGNMLCKDVLQETGNIGCFLLGFSENGSKRLVTSFKKRLY